MTVPVEQHSLGQVGKVQIQPVLSLGVGQELVNQERIIGHHFGLFAGDEIRIFVAEREQTTGFTTDDGHSPVGEIHQRSHVFAGLLTSLIQQTLGNHGPTATPAVDQLNAISPGFQQLHGGDANFRIVVIHKGVIVEGHGAVFRRRRILALALGKPFRERLSREWWLLPLPADTQHGRRERPADSGAGQPVGHWRIAAAQLVQAVDIRKHPRPQRHSVFLVIVIQKLVLQLGHVHAGLALRLARLAFEAQIQRLMQPLVGDRPLGAFRHTSRQRRPQEVSASARGMLLVSRRHERRAHRPVQFATRPHAIAHFNRA